ncbi:hypothetical protein QJS10_CPB17g00577 [Acorus calamus]|uniref:Reverse transcriptase domain-containing protein n=1 Tax=Acorus calamus TaxID=4465 RepID=A0AAV9CVN4_ACOCL|nr:hypothetical protein QJS10_CPB17g00577 [Acorus calamus]
MIRRALLDDGSTSDDPTIIKQHAVHYYQKLLNANSNNPIPSASAAFCLTEADQHFLSSAVSADDIEKALHSMKPLSSPGPAFADDLIIFMDGQASSAHALRVLLSQFTKESVLNINAQKSQLFHLGDPSALSSLLGIPACSLPVKHLGLPLISSYLTHQMCNPLVDKVHKCLSTWMGSLLSKAGRLELIRSVLLSLSYYWTASFSLPKRTIKLLEKLFRNFLWAGEAGVHKIHAVKWESIYAPKDEGGLGLKRLVDWNAAAMGLRSWEIASNHPSLWAT